jgi:hypothetical protein
MGSSALTVILSTLFDSENTMVVNVIVVILAGRLLQTQQIPFRSVLVKATNGLHLLIVCSMAILYENRLKS